MYIIFKEDKAEHLEHKLHKIKEFVCDVMEEIAEAKEHSTSDEEEYGHSMTRHSGRHQDEDYDDDYDMRMTRKGRGRGRGRY